MVLEANCLPNKE
ncbi:hypothetical protein EYZ11_012513 [Aspergillus tanneri]|uniref:Uncharacterized protein n=1 Tax=Aspergillus tanneri TaxID=1220188 RepID=A0A4S3J0M5_9EURO|nr:hypothetical protein EYZ11_012513 [Aspergillus tanneri]